jgi:hypothetical protein
MKEVLDLGFDAREMADWYLADPARQVTDAMP